MQIHNTRRNHSYLDSALQGFVARFCGGGVKLKLDSRVLDSSLDCRAATSACLQRQCRSGLPRGAKRLQ